MTALLRILLPVLLGAGLHSIFAGSKEEIPTVMPEALPLTTLTPQSEVSDIHKRVSTFLNRTAELIRNSNLSPKELTMALDLISGLVSPFIGVTMQKTENPLDTQLKIERLKRLQAQNALSQMMLSSLNNPNINQENLQKALQLK